MEPLSGPPADSNASYTYDNNGNTLTKTVGTDVTTYGWDYENRLISVQLPNGGGTVSFKYDPFGRRVQKVTPLATSNFIYDGGNIIEEVNSSGLVAATYVHGPAIDEPLQMNRNSVINYFEQDNLGSISSVSDTSGSIVESYQYDSYGKVNTSGGSLQNSFRLAGREWDREIGLYYNRARYFDPSAGRFLSEDPLGNVGGINLYEYVYSNPINLIDPSGLYGVKRYGNTLVVSATVRLYGPNASNGLAAYWQRGINSVWNGLDHFVGKCRVIFDVKVFTDMSQNVSSYGTPDANIFVEPMVPNFRSSQRVGGGQGHWWMGAESRTVSHEVGHIFGLQDEYRDFWHGIRVPNGWFSNVDSRPNAGHEGDIMASSEDGVVTDEDVKKVIGGNGCGCK